MREVLLRLGPGLTESRETTTAALAEGSVNFYLDAEGYLALYPGRTDLFLRGEEDPPAGRGTPPALTTTTRVKVFRDVRGMEHIVFVSGPHIREVYGNGFRHLYTMTGRSYGGRYYPDLFVHESKLIIVNFGDHPLLWDGLDGVVPLGVQETPLPPEVWSGVPPYVDSNSNGTPKGHGYGPWHYKNYWWPGKTPLSGPSENSGIDPSDSAWGVYQIVVQFFDKYGNHGPVSPASKTIRVKPNLHVSSPFAIDPALEYSDSPEWYDPSFLMADWYPPQLDEQVAGVRVGCTLSMNSDGGAGIEGFYFTEGVYIGTACSRMTIRKTDGVRSSSEAIDIELESPPQASGGCSWRGRTVLGGLEDPFIVRLSDKDLFGQFRGTNEYRLRDHWRASIPLGDRLVHISRSSTETMYETQDGSLGIIDQNFAHGSSYGRSFVDVGGAIFGLWNDGFGFYDGATHTFVDTPYYLQSIYLDNRAYVHSALKKGDNYYVVIRKDADANENTHLLLFNLKTKSWFLLAEQVNDICEWGDTILGVDDSIYELFKGTFPAPGRLKMTGIVPEGSTLMAQRNLLSARLLMEPSSIDTVTVTVTSELTLEDDRSGSMHTLPSKDGPGRATFPLPYWDDKFLYVAQPNWTAPRDIWVPVPISDGVAGFMHTVNLLFPAGHHTRLKAVGLAFGDDLVQSP